ncbi:MAG: Ig-like domain-containing protein [Clostridia bacterium]|nr:Ig-like domain-containing protein [Clostridia bacterium]
MMIRKCLSAFMVLLLLSVCTAAAAANDTFRIDQSVKTVFEGESFQLQLDISGEPVNGAITWKSGNERAATVDENGVVTGVAKGQATIVAVCKTEKRTYKANIQITVQKKVTSVALNESRLTVLSWDDATLEGLLQLDSELPVLVLTKGNAVSLVPVVEPNSASNRRVVLTSSDEKVLRVSGTSVTPKEPGECILTVSSQSNPEVSVSYHAFVTQKVTSVKVTSPSKNLDVGTQMQLSFEVAPENATIKSVKWTSQNEKIATVSENGIVTGIARGQVAIRATAADGSKRYGSVTVNVQQMATAIDLNAAELTVAVGYHKTIKATVLPANTNDKSVVWTSSDESIAKINGSGYITPVRAGECYVTCSSKTNPMVSASCRLIITQPVKSITFSDRSASIKVDEVLPLRWTVEPYDVTNAQLTFTSSNNNVATVDGNGVVYGRKRGEVTITAHATDGSNRTGRIKVQVIQPVKGVHMRNDTVRVGVDEKLTITAVLEPENANNNHMAWASDEPYYATIKGTTNRPSVTGHHWGTTTVRGVTEDGGFEVECVVNVGNYDKALKISDLYLQNNTVKITVVNESNMNITRFYGLITCYDIYGQPLPCTTTGVNCFECSYAETLYEGETTRHGRFNFNGYLQPAVQIGRVVMQITGYRTDTGYARNIKEENQVTVEYITANYIGYTPAPPSTPEP